MGRGGDGTRRAGAVKAWNGPEHETIGFLIHHCLCPAVFELKLNKRGALLAPNKAVVRDVPIKVFYCTLLKINRFLATALLLAVQFERHRPG
jgi:hypothetical protein